MFNPGPTKTFTAGAAIGANRRVVLTAGVLAAASATEVEIGTLAEEAFASGDVRAVILTNSPGTRQMVASGAITAGAYVYAAASGKVASTGSRCIGRTLNAASADGDIVEVLPIAKGDVADTLAQSLTANSSEVAGNTIVAGYTGVTVAGVTTDANDFIVLPPIADVPIGHTIRISANAGSNFELRTPASSNTKINDVDSDGSQEYLVTDTDMVIVSKRTTTGWVAQSITKLGAVRTAVVPD